MFCTKCNCNFINLALHNRLYHDKCKEYRCIFCGLHLNNGLDLFEHISSNHTDVNIRCCHLCNIQCLDLDEHVEYHDELKIYKCSLCFKLFSSRNNYINHVCIEELNLKCRKCGQNFNNESDLKIHVDEHKAKFKLESIVIDEDLISATNTLGQDETTHIKDFVCFYCDKKFSLKKLLHQHLHPNKDCCDENFPCQSLYTQHINSIKHSCKCEICHKAYTTYSLFLKHIHKSHIECTVYIQDKYVCSVCFKFFTTRYCAKRHHKDCLIKNSKTPKIVFKEILKCNICDKSYKNVRGLRYHMGEHDGSKKYECDCGKSFMTNFKLKQHRLTHSNKKNFKCKTCLARFKNKYTLKQHEMKHENGLTCYHCCEKFFRKSTLQNHIRDLECCGLNFSCYGLYLQHENVHEHKFKCDLCQKIYNTRSALIRHKSDVHYENTTYINGDYVCHICSRVFTTRHNATRHYRRNHPNLKDEKNFA